MKMNLFRTLCQRLDLPSNKGNKELSTSNYTIDKVIQDYKQTQILLARGPDNKHVVLKKIDTTLVRAELIANELAAGRLLKHPGIVKMLSSFSEGNYVYLVIEFISGVDLFEYLHSRDFQPIPEKEVRQIFQQVVKAASYIHKKNIVHRDLKLENIMLTAGSPNNKIKIIDFGLCAQAPCDSTFDSFLGSVEYACPEILSRSPYNGCKAEVWSLGVVLFSMLYGQFPFSAYDRERKFEGELCFPAEVNISRDVKDLISHMLSVDPRTRYDLKEVESHRWLKQ